MTLITYFSSNKELLVFAVIASAGRAWQYCNNVIDLKKESLVGGIILKYLDRWYEQPLGAAFAKAQRAEIESILPNLRGQRLLQLGFKQDDICHSTEKYWVRPSPNLV